MPRESWVKVHVELLDEDKLCGRPDSDFKLWVCLILLARQTTEDGVIHKMGPSALRDRFSLRCSTRRVQEALDHFAGKKMVELAEGSIRILNYEKRQAVKDYKEQNAERQRRWRERNVTGNGEVTSASNGQSRLEENRTDPPPKPPLRGATRLRRSLVEKPPPAPARWQTAGFTSEAEYLSEISRIAEANGGSEQAYEDAAQTAKVAP